MRLHDIESEIKPIVLKRSIVDQTFFWVNRYNPCGFCEDWEYEESHDNCSKLALNTGGTTYYCECLCSINSDYLHYAKEIFFEMDEYDIKCVSCNAGECPPVPNYLYQ